MYRNLIASLVGLMCLAAFPAAASEPAATAETAAKPAPAATADTPKPAAPPAESVKSFTYSPKPSDQPLGDPKAPVVVVEYASLSCNHCANAHREILPELQKQYIDTGKVFFVYRHFPLNAPALRAAQVVECAGKDRYHRFLKALFSMQGKWAFDADFVASIKNIVSVGGMSAAEVDSCVADKSLEEAILAIRKEAQEQFGVKSTPTFFINGEPFEGEMSFLAFKSMLDKVLEKATGAAAPAPANPPAP